MHHGLPRSLLAGFPVRVGRLPFLKEALRGSLQVAQLAGYVSEHAAYHHGEASLAGTIVGLAQDFVGSNNINLLVPSGALLCVSLDKLHSTRWRCAQLPWTTAARAHL